MNNYNILANFIANKYIDHISGADLGDRIVGIEPRDQILTGLLAEDRVEQTFKGDYKENEDTKYESIPSIGLKFFVKQDEDAELTIFPRGILFYTVLPEYKEVVSYFLNKISLREGRNFQSIDDLIKNFPDERNLLPTVYKKIKLEDVFPNGLVVELKDVSDEAVSLKAAIDETLRNFLSNIQSEVSIVNEATISYKDLQNPDLFKLVCSRKDEQVFPNWSFDIRVSKKENAGKYSVFVQFVNRTEKLKGKNKGYLPQIYDAGITVQGNVNTQFIEIPLDYFRYSFKDKKKCFSVAENASSSYEAKSNSISTENVPRYFQYRTKTNDQFNKYIEFQTLIDDPIKNLTYIHVQMQKDLEARRAEYENCKDTLFQSAREKFRKALMEYEQEVNRFGFGIEQIQYKDFVYKAFRLMNETFSLKVPGDHKNYKGWRLFQIVFIVSLICEVIESEYKDDESLKKATSVDVANLLYFPTGGGKTEAFLGISVFTMFFDRIRGKNIGVTGILKYPLRLLAVQQLDRVLGIIMKANIVRENDPDLKEANPFSVGFFIGSTSTPNKIYENDSNNNGSEAIIHGSEEDLNENYKFIDTCPVCGKKSVKVEFDPVHWKLNHVCTNPECTVKELPLRIIDNEIYRYLPSLIVSTVDKMAAVGYADDFKQLMGQVRYECPLHGYTWKHTCPAKFNCDEKLVELPELKDPIPTLLIQDEMHLVKESLGTFDSHYESFISDYAENLAPIEQRKKVRFIGATATISMYEEHIKHLYHKRGRRFPCEYPSRKQGRDFYSYVDTNDITRIIMGFAPYGRSISVGMWESVYFMRVIVGRMMKNLPVYLNELTNQGFVGDKKELQEELYNYWIDLVYNNRKDDVMDLDSAFLNQANDRLQDIGIPKFVTKQMTSDVHFQEVRQTLFDIQANHRNAESTNLILATSTISHGVDEDSFNNMFFYGIPNTNAEYIQAYSRSGRKYTGLVIDIIRLLRVRDRSYLKNFVLFHENKEDLVESVPINRWAKNAIYNTLPGLLEGLFIQYYAVRLNEESLVKANQVKKLLVDGSIEISDVIEKMIEVYGCSPAEKLSIKYQEIIKEEVYKILDAIKNGIFDNKVTLSQAIKENYSKHFAPMTSLRDTEEQVEIVVSER